MLKSNRRSIQSVRKRMEFGYGGISFPSWVFDPALATFNVDNVTGRIAKRLSPGPSTTGFPIQGHLDGSGIPDKLSYGRGAQITGYFYGTINMNQGTICGWWIPEKDRDASQGNDEFFYYINSSYYARYEHDNARITARHGGQSFTIPHTTVAGTLYFLCFSWDCNNKIDGTNYARASINDTHTFGISTQPTANAPQANPHIGSLDASASPANALLDGWRIYDRVLSDGTYGNPAIAGTDELNLMYAAGAGKLPEQVCPEGIVWGLPTDGVAGQLSTGVGEAFSFPWGDNELTNWHLQNDTVGAPDNWTAVNAPTLADAATADILMNTRAQKITVDAADEGIRGDTTPVAESNKVVLSWLQAGGANQGVDLRIYDNDNAANIVEMTTDLTAWTHFNTCYKVPVGCTDVQHFIESTDADSYDIHAQQVMVLPNKADNGGLEGTYVDESGGGGGTINVAPGWDEYNCDLTGVDTLDESATAHSGSKSQEIDVTADNKGIQTTGNVLPAGKWVLITYWLYGVSGNVNVRDSAAADFSYTVTPNVGSWTRYSLVEKISSSRPIRVSGSGGAANFLVDDISVIELDDVSITATAATRANSLEPSPSLRVDGLDTLTEPILGLTETKGSLQFTYTPRHTEADALKFGHTTPFVFAAIGAASNYIQVYWAGVSQLRLAYNLGGGELSNLWATGGGAFTPGTAYVMKIIYDSTSMRLYVDNVLRITVVGAVEFVNIPTTAWMGSTNAATGLQGDAVFG